MSENNASKIAKIVSRTEENPFGKNIFLLAEEDYGKSFSFFCKNIPFPTLALSPSGCVYCCPNGEAFLTSIPGCNELCGIMPEQAAKFLQNKSVLICSSIHKYINHTQQIFKQLKANCKIAAIFDSQKIFTLDNSGYIHEKSLLEAKNINYNCIVTDVSASYDRIASINSFCREDVPIVVFGSTIMQENSYMSVTSNIFSGKNGICARREGQQFRQYLDKSKYDAIYKGELAPKGHYKDLCVCLSSWKFKGIRMLHADKKTALSTHENGFRQTAYQNEKVDNDIYIVGNSCTIGYFSEDKHTISSYLQNICNEQHQKKMGLSYNVHNKAVASSLWHNNYLITCDIHLKQGDFVIVNVSPDLGE